MHTEPRIQPGHELSYQGWADMNFNHGDINLSCVLHVSLVQC